MEVALSIRHDDVGSGFARRSVNDRRRHLHVSAIARNYPSPVCGGNELQRNRFAGCQHMWAACRCAYRDELAYRTVAGTLSIFDLPSMNSAAMKCVLPVVPTSYLFSFKIVNVECEGIDLIHALKADDNDSSALNAEYSGPFWLAQDGAKMVADRVDSSLIQSDFSATRGSTRVARRAGM